MSSRPDDQVQLQVRMTIDEKAALEAVAKMYRLSMSQFVKEAVAYFLRERPVLAIQPSKNGVEK